MRPTKEEKENYFLKYSRCEVENSGNWQIFSFISDWDNPFSV